MPMTLEIKIIKNKKNIGNCLYYDYSSIKALEEAKNIIDYLELPFYLLEDLIDFVKENDEWSVGSGYRTCIN